MTKEAMTLALEALTATMSTHGFREYIEETKDKAIKALEEALAKQEQGKPLVPLRLEWEKGYPEDVAFGTQRQMDRLKKWLDKYFAMIQSAKQEQGEPVACTKCKKLEDELEPLRIKSELWKRDAIVWKSAYDVEVGYREQEQGEPVAWMRKDGQRVTTASDRRNYPDYETRYSIPLYTTPYVPTGRQPAQKPLTDEQIGDIAALYYPRWQGHEGFARAIEAAHGIKE